MNMDIFMLIVFCLLASIDGIRDAVTYHMAVDSTKWWERDIRLNDKKINEHIIYVVMRVLYTIPIVFIVVDDLKYRLFSSTLITLCFALIFSFFHNGFYYEFRNIFAKYRPKKYLYKDGFFSQSKTTTARLTFGPVSRTIQMGLGIIIYITYLHYARK